MAYDHGCVQGGGPKPAMKGAEYKVSRQGVGKMPGPVVSDGQARSPQAPHLGATRGVGAGGAKVGENINRSSHSRAWGLKGS